MLRRRVAAVLDRLHVCQNRGERRIVTLLEISYESRRTPERDPEHVVQHENLSIDVRPGANTDNGHVELLGHRLPEFVRHAFEQHDVGACIL